MTTKQTIIEQALDDISFNGDYDASLLARGLRTLDQMMAAWLNEGVDIGYLQDETTAITDESGLLVQFLKVTRMNLACELADQLDLFISPNYRLNAGNAYKALFSIIPPASISNPYMPLGAGNTRGCNTYAQYQNLGTDYIEDLTNDADISITDDDGFIISFEE
jgi:hypothetical protein